MNELFEAAKILAEQGKHSQANAVYGEIAHKIEDISQEAPTKGVLWGGVTGLLVGSLIIPGTWIPLGISGAVVGMFVVRPFSNKRVAALRERLIQERNQQ